MMSNVLLQPARLTQKSWILLAQKCHALCHSQHSAEKRSAYRFLFIFVAVDRSSSWSCQVAYQGNAAFRVSGEYDLHTYVIIACAKVHCARTAQVYLVMRMLRRPVHLIQGLVSYYPAIALVALSVDLRRHNDSVASKLRHAQLRNTRRHQVRCSTEKQPKSHNLLPELIT